MFAWLPEPAIILKRIGAARKGKNTHAGSVEVLCMPTTYTATLARSCAPPIIGTAHSILCLHRDRSVTLRMMLSRAASKIPRPKRTAVANNNTTNNATQ
jgi:hypothetical protein